MLVFVNYLWSLFLLLIKILLFFFFLKIFMYCFLNDVEEFTLFALILQVHFFFFFGLTLKMSCVNTFIEDGLHLLEIEE